jgi:hypothetical protein
MRYKIVAVMPPDLARIPARQIHSPELFTRL